MPILKVEPPLAGIQRRTSFQKAIDAPFSAFDLVNFWPIDPKSGRAMLAIRPPLQSIGSPTTPSPPITNMISPVNGTRSGYDPESLLIAVSDGDGDADGKLYVRDSAGDWIAATGAQAEAVDDDRSIHAAAILQDVYIPVAGAKPIRFRYSTGAAATLVETAGTCPTDNRFAVVWQGALVLAGNTADRNIAYFSRIGDPLDWDFTVATSDRGGAFFTSTEDESRVGGPITALMPQTAETLIVSTTSGMLAMRGHPRQGGVFENLTTNLYALGQGAWAKIPGDTLFFMSKQGLIRLDPQPGSIPIAIQKSKIPFELLGLTYDLDDPTIAMAYDSRWHALILTVRNNNEEQAWMYDLETGGFSRMRFDSYPWVLYEHPPFIDGSATSGVLHGRYDGIHRFDIFGTDETVHGSAIWGPVRISPDDHSRSRLNRVRILFGRDTPSSNISGQFRVATGVDGQDAISKMLRGEHQFEVPLSTFRGANDSVYPLLAGGAAVFAITTERGDLAIEQITADVTPVGRSPFLRTTQISVTGTPTSTFTSTDFDATTWVGYSEATPIAPDCASLPDHSCFIDLSTLPAAWWAQVDSSGGDIRATDDTNSPLPLDLVHFDAVNETGFAVVKVSQTSASPTPVRLWVGKDGQAQPAPDDAIGQYNAYDDNWLAFYPDGGGNDRTSNTLHLTHVNSTPGDVTGPIGVLATDYDEANHSGSDSWAHAELAAAVTAQPLTLAAVARRHASGTSLDMMGFTEDGGGIQNHYRLYLNWNGSDIGFARFVGDDGSPVAADSSVSGVDVETYHHCVGVAPDSSEHTAYVNGGGAGTQSTTTTLNDLDQILLGRARSDSVVSTTYNGDVSLAQYHTIARDACWVAYQHDMLDQATFWGGGWGAFVSVNDPTTEPDPPVSACPSGIVAVSETGTWAGYDELVADPVPSGFEGLTTLLDFSHWIDLSLMSATWWSNVAADGSDIRATGTDNVFLPLDLVLFNQGANTGFAVVRGRSNTTAGLTVRLWAGNGSAVTVPACAAYGQYRAYDEFTQGFWPRGGGEDRTQWERDLTANGGLVVGAISGPAGAGATRYDGTDDYTTVDTTPASGTSATDTPPLTLFTTLRVNSPDIFHVAHPIDLVNGDNHYYALHQAADLHPFLASIHSASDQWLSSLLVGVIDDWTPVTVAFGLGTDGNVIGRIIAETTVDSFSGTHTGLLTKLEGLNRFQLGAFRLSDGTTQLHFDGDLSFSSLHSTFRPIAWSLYNRLMLDQSSFWDATAGWTADSNTLPQP